MREDQILFLLSTRLKDIAVDLNIFMCSATQTNATWRVDSMPDANILKGSKAIADKVDIGSVLLPLSETDQEAMNKLAAKGYPMPNRKLSIFKNRRGSFTRSYLWLAADMSTCRYVTLFATDWNYQVIEDLPAFGAEVTQ